MRENLNYGLRVCRIFSCANMLYYYYDTYSYKYYTTCLFKYILIKHLLFITLVSFLCLNYVIRRCTLKYCAIHLFFVGHLHILPLLQLIIGSFCSHHWFTCQHYPPSMEMHTCHLIQLKGCVK